tara:strand:- start:262 stop:1704 length:1443 start_codon:yes stop_codon:yes gene_type:complete
MSSGAKLIANKHFQSNSYFSRNGEPYETDVTIHPFHSVFRRYEPYTRDNIEITTTAGDSFDTTGTSDKTITYTIDKGQDYFITGAYIKITLPELTPDYSATKTNTSYLNWTNNVGHAMVKEVTLKIGTETIEKFDSTWLDVRNELYDTNKSEYTSLSKHEAKNAYLHSGDMPTTTNATTHMGLTLYVNLPFWFSKSLGTALPAFKLRKDITIEVKYRATLALVNTNLALDSGISPGAPSANLFIETMNVADQSSIKCKHFNQDEITYLIEYMDVDVHKMSFSTSSSTTTKTLDFIHPSSKLIWVIQNDNVFAENTTFTSTTADATANVAGTLADKNDYFCYLSDASNTEKISGQSSTEPFTKFYLNINGQKYPKEGNGSTQTASYYRLVEPRNNGLRVPSKHVYMFSFESNKKKTPIYEQYYENAVQPTGTLDFNSVGVNQNKTLTFTGLQTTSNTASVYSVSYNILSFTQGSASLLHIK